MISNDRAKEIGERFGLSPGLVEGLYNLTSEVVRIIFLSRSEEEILKLHKSYNQQKTGRPEPSVPFDWHDFVPSDYRRVAYRRIVKTTENTIILMFHNPKRAIELPLDSMLVDAGPRQRVWLPLNLIKKHGLRKADGRRYS